MIDPKPFEYWAILAGMVLYAATRDAEREPILRRAGKVAASAMLAVGLSPSIAPYLQDSEQFAVVVIMAFGILALDVATALIADREFIKSLIQRRLGGKGGPDEGNP